MLLDFNKVLLRITVCFYCYLAINSMDILNLVSIMLCLPALSHVVIISIVRSNVKRKMLSAGSPCGVLL